MKIIMFYHSLVSDWNHGNAHFLRGIYGSLLKEGHEVSVYEPQDGWSLTLLKKECGEKVLKDFRASFPQLNYNFYNPQQIDLNELLQGADLVVVHEWNDPLLVKAIGQYRSLHHFILLFHDTHHRAVSAKEEMGRYDLTHYDGVLAFGKSLKDVYQKEGWHKRIWTWHEAADIDSYYPKGKGILGDVVWVGNWGDEERTKEIHEFIIKPIKSLQLKATFYGVRYPQAAIDSLKSAGIEYGGYLPSNRVADIYSQYRATIHVPRRFYRDHLPGIPTIRPFEAMACKIPLLSAPWEDSENLFTVDKDYLMADSGKEMTHLLKKVLLEREVADSLSDHAYQTILSKHTCGHRAKELLNIYQTCMSQLDIIGGSL
jgi:spore maturation protein CgeB